MMKKTLLVGLFSLVFFVVFSLALTTKVSAATFPLHILPHSPNVNCNIPLPGRAIDLQAHANGAFVTADLNGGSLAPLRADSTTVGTWQRFDFILDNTGAIYLRAHANGAFVTADLNGGSLAPLRADSTTMGTWQRFDWICVSNFTIALQAHANGAFVTADLNGGSLAPLRADSTTIGTWQRFDWANA